jgi:hypothetical protein
MPPQSLRFGISVAAVLLLLDTSCDRSCVSIGCQPLITVDYGKPIRTPYDLSITFNGTAFTAACPTATGGPIRNEPKIFCSEAFFTLAAPNLIDGAVKSKLAELDLRLRLKQPDGERDVAAHVIAPFSGVLNEGCAEPLCYSARGSATTIP